MHRAVIAHGLWTGRASRYEGRKTNAAIRETGEGDRRVNLAFRTYVIGHAPDGLWPAHSSARRFICNRRARGMFAGGAVF